MFQIGGKYGNAIVMADGAEESCVTQVANMMNHPAFNGNVVIMPDTHAGAGSVVGFTMPMTDMVIPNVIGVDIGCGMLMHSFKIDTMNRFMRNRPTINRAIRDEIPTGNNIHETSRMSPADFLELLDAANAVWHKAHGKISAQFGTVKDFRYTYQYFDELCDRVNIEHSYAANSIGTLGGGNHFIEFGWSNDNPNLLYATVHSGSRNLGLKVANYHQKVASNLLKHQRNVVLRERIEEIKNTVDHAADIPKRIKEAKRQLGLDFDVNMNGLEYLTGAYAVDYLIDMIFVQLYASLNRKKMMHAINSVLISEHIIDTSIPPVEEIESIHNYINFEDMIIRKGAIQAFYGQRCIIPFNMEDGMMVCEGRGNAEWNFSAAHGAGRLMGRNEAKRKLNLNKYVNSMKELDIYSSEIPLDEVKGAYKPKKEIVRLLEPTIYVNYFVKPVMNIKAGD